MSLILFLSARRAEERRKLQQETEKLRQQIIKVDKEKARLDALLEDEMLHDARDEEEKMYENRQNVKMHEEYKKVKDDLTRLKNVMNTAYSNAINNIPMIKCGECGDNSDTWICDKCRAI